MQRRAKTFATGLVLVFGTTTAGLMLNSGTATAAEPVLAGSCGASVQGTPGQPVTLSAQALLGPVNQVVSALPLIGKNLVGPLVGGVINTLGPIPIGVLPNGSGTLGGSAIGGPAAAALKGTALEKTLAPLGLGLADSVGKILSSTCTVLVKGVNAVAAPVQDGAAGVGKVVESATAPIPQLPGIVPGLPGGGTGGGGGGGTTNPGTNPGGGSGGGGTTNPGGGASTPGTSTPGTISGTGSSITGTGLVPLYGAGSYNFGRSPMADYASLPFAKAGLFSPSPGVRYGGSVPGYSPQFGILGTDDADGVQQAGHAEALDGLGSNKVAVPVLLAVLALSGVTASLVRTWVLRRTVA